MILSKKNAASILTTTLSCPRFTEDARFFTPLTPFFNSLRSQKTAYLNCFRYLGTEYSRYCVPSNVSSGLATLPLKYVWLDGKENKSWPTNSTLPTGEPLNGSQAYLDILSYFTTNNLTPLNVSDLGKEQLNIFYPTVS